MVYVNVCLSKFLPASYVAYLNETLNEFLIIPKLPFKVLLTFSFGTYIYFFVSEKSQTDA